MKNNYLFRVMAIAMIFLFSRGLGFGQAVSITSTNTPLNQDFNTLSNTAGSTTNNLAITGWFMTETGGGARDNEQYGVDTGGGSTGDTYSFGTALSIDRAFGSLRSGTLIATYGAAYTNNSGTPITSLEISYSGEQWRLGAAARTDRLDFQYSLDATSLTSGTWTDINELDFITPNTTTIGAKDGNANANRTSISHAFYGLSLPENATFWIRWNDADASGADDGLAIDDFSLIANPTPSLASISSPSIAEVNVGTINLTFTATLTQPSIGETVVTLASTDVTATVGSDFLVIPANVTIPNGSTSATFNVLINGDTDIEPNETFTVTGTLGAISKNGTGTILDDDAPVVPIISINDVTIAESNSGTITASFTVSLSSPALAGGVTFDIATANGTATTANNDYVANSFTGQTITEGTTGPYTFTVSVNGDTSFEPNETFFVNITNPSGATIVDGQGIGTITNDDLAPPTLISAIQGTGLTAALTGTRTAQGIVTRAFFGTGSLNGFYMQEEDADADADPATSEGIFVFNPTTQPAVGDIVSVTGPVIDFGTTQLLTEFSPKTTAPTEPVTVTVVSTGNTLPAAVSVTLPVANVSDLERYEGMLVTLTASTGNLVVTNNFGLGQYGQIVLAANDLPTTDPPTNAPGTDARIDQFTQFNAPSVDGNATYQSEIAKRTIYVDDANTLQNIDPIIFGRGGMPLSASNTIRTGDEVASVTAVLDQRFEGYRLQIGNSSELNILPTNVRPTTPNLTGSPTLVVGNMNVLNYFNGDGLGTGFPTPRGANTTIEFARQRDKILNAILNSGADILSLNEIENDGFGANSAIQDLVNGLNSASSAGTWAFITPPSGTILSGDEITCGMIYKPAKVSPAGDIKALFTGEFALVNRAAIAQTFLQIGNNEKFTLVGNHFKSKGSSGASGLNTDQNDGQGSFNDRRKKQATELAAWLATDPTGSGDPDILIVGDLNAYAMEDPLKILELAGYPTLIPSTNTSYQFSGAHGALDHALGSATLAAQKVDAKKWNINADEPTAIDYNIQLDNGTVIKSPSQIVSLYSNDQFRNSDHDPVLVGLKLCPKPAENVTTASICLGETYTWTLNNQDYTTNTTVTIVNDNCTANEKLVLTIIPNSENVTTISACDTYTWSVTGQAYTMSGTYTGATTNCVTEKLVLTITPSSENVTTIAACDTYTWSVTGQTYTSSGTYTGTTTNCVTEKLVLTITPSSENVTTIAACNTYTWSVTGQTYTSSGTYTGSTTNCVTEKLVLTINTKAPTVITNETICVGETYTWTVNGQNYTVATNLTITGVDCDADQTLNLTIDNTECSDAICTTLPADYAISSFMACTPSGSTTTSMALITDALNGMAKTFGLTPNNRTFTLNLADISSGGIFTMLSGVSSASSKFGLGGATFANNSTWPRVPLNASGQLANALFRNTLALYFNLKNSTKLGDVLMTNIHHTQPLTACGALAGNGVITSYQMPTTVISYLNNATNNYDATVAGLYALANDALGGKTGLPNLSTIASAIDKINKAFNGCRLISNPSTSPSLFGTGLKVTENSAAFDAPAKGRLFVTLIEGDAETGNIMGVTEIGTDGISGFEPILNNTYKLILGTDPEGSRTPQAPNGYKIVGEKITYYNEEQPIAGPSQTGIADGEIEIGTATNGAKVAASNRVEVEYLLEPTAPLPVTLVAFEAKPLAQGNFITWKTTSEVNFSHFDLEKSSDAQRFDKMVKIDGKKVENYSYLDKNVKADAYYRLKMVDANGSFNYSKIVFVPSNNGLKIGLVYPNPTLGTIANLEIETNKSETWEIIVLDNLGKQKSNSKITLNVGHNIVPIYMLNETSGTYFVVLQNKNGEKITRKVLVQ